MSALVVTSSQQQQLQLAALQAQLQQAQTQLQSVTLAFTNALNVLNSEDVKELRVMRVVPPLAQMPLTAVAILMGIANPTDWKSIRRMLI